MIIYIRRQDSLWDTFKKAMKDFVENDEDVIKEIDLADNEEIENPTRNKEIQKIIDEKKN